MYVVCDRTGSPHYLPVTKLYSILFYVLSSVPHGNILSRYCTPEHSVADRYFVITRLSMECKRGGLSFEVQTNSGTYHASVFRGTCISNGTKCKLCNLPAAM